MLRRVVVVDSGWGGEMVADLIEEELAIAEVVRLIDWRNAPYSRRRRGEILELAESLLEPYWRSADAVVLAGYELALVAAELRARHPEVKIVSFQMEKFLYRWEGRGRRVLFLTDPRLARMDECCEVVAELEASGATVFVPECTHWTELIDEGEMTPAILAQTLCGAGGEDYQSADTIFVANTHYWDVVEDVKKLLRCPVKVVDLRQELMDDLCRALELRGGSGRRQK